MMADMYERLGVSETATKDEIKKAYRKLAAKFHPDRNQGDEASARRMQEINEAYETLSDEEKRQEYDLSRRFGSHGGRSFSGMGDVDMESIFGSAFETMFGHGRYGRAGMGDMAVSVEIPLSVACKGGKRRISLHGVGEMSIDLPKGVTDGSILIANQGGRTVRMMISVVPEHGWTLEGDDISTTVELTPWDAALGTEKTMKHPSGETLSVKIPAGMKPSAKLRLKGRGLGKGDMFVKVSVVVPKPESDEEMDLYRRIAALRK